MRRIVFRLSILILTLVIGIASYVAWAYYNRPFIEGQDNPVSYTILKDEMDTMIVIGVDADISERQLCATLSRAANEHMNDVARDYLTSQFIWIEAYLTKDGKQSVAAAGTLRRIVSPGNHANRNRLLPDFLTDRFTLSLSEAKQSFR